MPGASGVSPTAPIKVVLVNLGTHTTLLNIRGATVAYTSVTNGDEVTLTYTPPSPLAGGTLVNCEVTYAGVTGQWNFVVRTGTKALFLVNSSPPNSSESLIGPRLATKYSLNVEYLSGGAVRSRSEEALYGYYEARMNASKVSMSSTFWLSGGRKQEAGGDVTLEIDIVETYDWMAPPSLADLTNSALNTACYDRVRGHVPRKQAAAGNGPKVSVPKIASDYVNVYKPAGDVFPGPNAANLVAGQFYEDWVPNDHCFIKSSEELVRNLVDIASKGGNYLLNVSPTGDGALLPQAVERLKAIGAWMKANRESIQTRKVGNPSIFVRSCCGGSEI